VGDSVITQAYYKRKARPREKTQHTWAQEGHKAFREARH